MVSKSLLKGSMTLFFKKLGFRYKQFLQVFLDYGEFLAYPVLFALLRAKF